MGIGMTLLGRIRNIRLNPAQFLVAGFALVIFIGSILLSLPAASADGSRLRYLDALFTATSATCVTGLVVVDTGLQFSLFGELVILVLIQVGGLGFMSMATLIALALGRRITLRGRLFLQESLNQFSMAGLIRLTRHIALTTLVLEAIGAVILAIRFSSRLPAGQAAYYGIFHAVSAFCNAGFDLFGPVSGAFSSITSWATDAVVVLTMAALIIAGGLGFPVIVELSGRRHANSHRVSLHTRLVLTVTVFLLTLGTLVILGLEFANPSTMGHMDAGNRLLAAFFQALTPRTAGFNTVDTASLRPATLFFVMILMFIGASPSSTGGGIKTSTFGVLISTISSTIRGYDEVEMYERRIPRDLSQKASTIASIALALVAVVTMLLSITESATFLEVMFEAMSAFGTVGLSTGITPRLSDFGRILIIMTMFMGRLGPLTVVVALAQRKKIVANVHLAEERVMIG
jgi:trk system potassium uptake protein TrkH